MCINPSNIWVQRGPNWEQLPVPCKTCWRCKQNRVNDYVARSLAEAAVSKHVCAITLTYAPRADLADKVLHPRHFQLFMKLLRRAGHKVRYLVAGEYGDMKGRAHFHALLFFTELAGCKPLTFAEVQDGMVRSAPLAFYNPSHMQFPDTSAPFSREIPQKRMVHIREWPHGHITCDWTATEQAARYVCKYLLSDDKNNAWFSLSKKPALGAAWFAKRASLAVDLGVMPSSFNYLPPGSNKDRPYMMRGATRRDYLNAISTDPAWRPKLNEWVRKTFDKHALARAKAAGDQWARDNPEAYLEKFTEHFAASYASNAKSYEAQEAQRLWDEYWDGASPVHLKRMAQQWGLQNEEEFKGFARQKAADGYWLDDTPIPHGPNLVPTGQHFPGCACSRCTSGGASTGGLSGSA